jgi:signal transduction histidine kinase
LIFEDVTKEVKMEEDSTRMGELAAVGQLAASIAHELRNPLSSIKGAAQLLKEQYDEQEMIAEFLEIIIDEVNGLSRLTTEFLDYARPTQLELKPTSVNDVVDKTLQLMSVHITDNNIVVRENPDPAVPLIQADEDQLEQVLRNIFINAMQAMPYGGSLHLTVRPEGEGQVAVQVADTGVGISPENLKRLFVPFFTTKEEGTGLGLALCYSIVQAHGGKIDVESQVGHGTAFTITMPVR